MKGHILVKYGAVAIPFLRSFLFVLVNEILSSYFSFMLTCSFNNKLALRRGLTSRQLLQKENDADRIKIRKGRFLLKKLCLFISDERNEIPKKQSRDPK